MKYLGGKHTIARWIAAIVHRVGRGRPYYEPFVGGGAVLPLIRLAPRTAGDLCAPLVAMWRAVGDGWSPPSTLSRDQWESAKALPDDDPLKAFAGFACSFGGIWFASYANDTSGRSFAGIGRRSLMLAAPHVRNVRWRAGDYRETTADADGAVIYCDPPYRSNPGDYRALDVTWDVDAFWRWAEKAADRNVVLVSEYQTPLAVSARVVWQRARTEFQGNPASTAGRGRRVVERLYALGL